MTSAWPLRAAVIMAGGSGERFWPLSRQLRPKQLLKLNSPDKTMLEESVTRLAPMIPAERIYIVTSRELVAPIRAAEYIPSENVLGEPAKRNTTGALVYAAAQLLSRHEGSPDGISMAVVTADHAIGEPELFRRTVDAALSVGEEHNGLVTMGIAPTRPETGYGYIQADESTVLDAPNGAVAHPVKAFHEKPNREVAESFIEKGGHYWNSGMFFWKISSFLTEMDRVRPEFARLTLEIADALREGDDAKADALFHSIESISIDYSLMEHAKNVHVIKASFPWDDVGAWTAMDRSHEHDVDGNVTVGDPVLADTRDCIVVNEAGADKIAVSVVGAEGLVVVVTDDGVLVIPKDRAQDVRHAVAILKARKAKQV